MAPLMVFRKFSINTEYSHDKKEITTYAFKEFFYCALDVMSFSTMYLEGPSTISYIMV